MLNSMDTSARTPTVYLNTTHVACRSIHGVFNVEIFCARINMTYANKIMLTYGCDPWIISRRAKIYLDVSKMWFYNRMVKMLAGSQNE